MALFFHFPLVFDGYWNWRAQARVIACIRLFWITEDFLWFVLNPAFGLALFSHEHIPWHLHWWAGAPVDYWMSLGAAMVLLWLSCREARPRALSR